MTHVLACGSQYFWCTGGQANAWVIPLGAATIVAGGIVIAIIAALRR